MTAANYPGLINPQDPPPLPGLPVDVGLALTRDEPTDWHQKVEALQGQVGDYTLSSLRRCVQRTRRLPSVQRGPRLCVDSCSVKSFLEDLTKPSSLLFGYP